MSQQPNTKKCQRALFAGDLLAPYIEAALEFLPEERIMEILRECGAENISNLADFRALLTGDLNFPSRLFSDIGSALVKAGLPQERAFHYTHIKKISRRTLAKMNAIIFTHLSRQEMGRECMDVVCCSMVTCGAYDVYISNDIVTDCLIEERRSYHRRARLVGIALQEETCSWFWLNHLKWCAVYCPTNVGEPKAEVRVVHPGEATVIDPQFPDLPLQLPVKPSLRAVAQKHGLDLTERDGMVYLDGQAVAVLDDCPGRSIDGFYRMIVDVRMEAGRTIMEKPASKVRPYHGLLLVQDFRYHLDRSFPAFEIEMEFSVSRIRQWLLCAAAIYSRKAWKLFIRGSGNPWVQLLHLLEKPTAPKNEQDIDRYFRSYCQPQVAPSQLPPVARLEYFRAQFGLSPREMEVLNKMVEGKSNLEISADLAITELTVKSHVSRVLSKTGFPNRQKLTASLIGQ